MTIIILLPQQKNTLKTILLQWFKTDGLLATYFIDFANVKFREL
ncbi:MAG: hypothetical protein ACTHJ5_14100 [Ilyomonas sp.]